MRPESRRNPFVEILLSKPLIMPCMIASMSATPLNRGYLANR
jgi:hypothetical protein